MGTDQHHDPGFLRSRHNRLNVIQIMCDQLPYYALGCYGHPLVQTPNIDGLAERGVLCSNAYAQNPVCCPSRASMLSGLYPSNHGVLSNLNNLELMNPLGTSAGTLRHRFIWATGRAVWIGGRRRNCPRSRARSGQDA